MEWFYALGTFEKILWVVVIVSSLVFVVQTVMTFMGMDSDGDMGGGDVDMAVDTPFELFTFRNFVNFFLGFGWTAIALKERFSVTVTVVLSVVAGVALVAAVMYLFYLMSRMEQSGNIDLRRSAKGCRGKVYIAIPEGGVGKVQITIQGAVREYDALCRQGAVPSGVPIVVVEAADESTLIVEKL